MRPGAIPDDDPLCNGAYDYSPQTFKEGFDVLEGSYCGPRDGKTLRPKTPAFHDTSPIKKYDTK